MGSRSSSPAPAPEPKVTVDAAPEKTEVVAARTQAKETMAGPTTRRRRGSLGRMSSLLTAGYRGYGTEDRLG
jgi:hypothetical protein